MQRLLSEKLNNLNALEESINYRFKNKGLLLTALIHSSYANEKDNKDIESNERLEFLGDTILNMLISERIYLENRLHEGEMSKLRANIVCEDSLAKCALQLDLGEYLLLGKGELVSGGNRRESTLADAFEALLGAIYLDGGMENARKFVNATTGSIYRQALEGTIFLDYKTKLQEIVQAKGIQSPKYVIVEEKGPDHNKEYISQVRVDNGIIGTGRGRSKKEAEQNAAKQALASKGWI